MQKSPALQGNSINGASTPTPKTFIEINLAGPNSGITESCAEMPSFSKAALCWLKFGLNVIPVIPGTKKTAVKWDPWLSGLNEEQIQSYWEQHPNHELGFIVGDDFLVLDADSQESMSALAILEEACDLVPNFIVSTAKGSHHYFRRDEGTYARSDSHSTEAHPERIDVKTGRALVMLPPSTGKSIEIMETECADDLVSVDQSFIEAVFRHNGRTTPRQRELTAPIPLSFDHLDKTLRELRAMLEHIDPDCGYDDWVHALMAIHHETGGSDDGFAIAGAWSSKGKKYSGPDEIRSKWHSFEDYTGDPITVATIRKMVDDTGNDWMEVCAAVEPGFELIDDTDLASDIPVAIAPVANPLDRFSLKGKSEELAKQAVEQKPLLGEVALLGQATVFYAAPNTGKTLITLKLLIDAIKHGRIDPSNVYYINVDDTLHGLQVKLEIAEEYGFHMLSEGHQEFDAKEFLGVLTELVIGGRARGIVIILDTLKKFTDLMDKRASSTFTKTIRRFVLQGGTVIALAHTNKNPGSDGELKYAGTTDIVDDFDCAYTLAAADPDHSIDRVVTFKNFKRRGNVVRGVAYRYSIEEALNYPERLLTVVPVDAMELLDIKKAEEVKADSEVIDAVSACINDGINTKMKLAECAAERSGASKRVSLKIIEKYTGDDPMKHRWTFTRGGHGAKVFSFIEPASRPPETDGGEKLET